jgi:hypothetical protein
MSHVPRPLLERFLREDLDESAAIGVALHLDDCPLCRQRADTLDPLVSPADALPELPAELAIRFDALAASPADVPTRADDRPEIGWVGAGAALLVAVAWNQAGWTSTAAAWIAGLDAAAAAWVAVVGAAGPALAMCGATLLAAAAAAETSEATS